MTTTETRVSRLSTPLHSALSVVISTLNISSRPSNPLITNAFLLVPRIRLLLTTVPVYKLCLLTYLRCLTDGPALAVSTSGRDVTM